MSPQDDRAGLYVLGALNAEEMRAVRLAAGRDDVLTAEIAEWERRLTPLTALVDPVEPPATLWAQLDGRLARITGTPDPIGEIYQPPTQRARSGRRGRRGGVSPWWRAAAIGAGAVAAGLVVALLMRPPPAPEAGQFAMLLPSRSGEGGWLLRLQRNGSILVVAQGALPATLQQSYELWALPENSDRPLPMGLLPVTASTEIKPPGLPKQKFQFLVSLEAKGGSQTGLPTSQVLFQSDFVGR